jgi:hypothetical protein
MRLMLPLLLVLPLFAAAAEDQAARTHAADLIHLRAERIAGSDPTLARHYARLAEDVRAGRVSVEQADGLLRLGGTLPPPSAAVGAAPPAMTPERATALLDGVAAPLAPPPPVPSAAVTTPAAPPVIASAAPPAPVPAQPAAAPTAPPRISARVLAIEPGADAKAGLVAIDAGSAQGVAEGDRFAIQREGATRVLARASKVSVDMTIALIIPGTWTDERAEIAEGDAAISVDDR